MENNTGNIPNQTMVPPLIASEQPPLIDRVELSEAGNTVEEKMPGVPDDVKNISLAGLWKILPYIWLVVAAGLLGHLAYSYIVIRSSLRCFR